MKIGILGGTFDPVHKGHLQLAEEAYTRLKLDSVLFMPAFIPPHKQDSVITSPEHRLAMLERALKELPYCQILDFELKQQKVVYTVDTLLELKKMYSINTEFFFLVGSDFIYEYQTWKKPELLLTLAEFVVAARPGFVVKVLPPSTQLLEGDFINVSSSEIRDNFAHNSNNAEFIPEQVLSYINEFGLYKYHEKNK